MDDLVYYIENRTDLPPVDRTNLSGLFTMHTEGWLPMRLPPPPPNGNGRVDFSSLPTNHSKGAYGSLFYLRSFVDRSFVDRTGGSP